ncbi:small conductance calcium-activated potassium channel protein-like isoform X3 [Daphnia pulex]|nr:small conductance calcium-activated potassium channel protein-like isoform X3 [Daphnia pulex]
MSSASFPMSRKRLSALTVSKRWKKVSHQLHTRKLLFEKRKRISDFALAVGMLGIIIMIIENELASAGVYTKSSLYSFSLKAVISFTTMILLVSVMIYHSFEVQIFLIQNCVNDWRIAMTWQRIIQMSFELLICAIHPIPGEPYFFWKTNHTIDVTLGLPMLFRFYLIGRAMHLHKYSTIHISSIVFSLVLFLIVGCDDNKLFTDTTSRSIGAFNNIAFDTRFIFKTLMAIYPGTVLLVVVGSLWIVASWTMRQCERYYDEEYNNLLNTMWLIMITFLTIGYGDMFPKTYCGRSISVATGFMGAGCTALLVAVILKKMELTQAEKRVHDLMRDTQFTKELKNAAANVLRESWLIYKYTKLVKRVNPGRVRNHQRKFLQAIHSMQNAKMKHRNLMDDLHVRNNPYNNMDDQNAANKITSEIYTRQNILEERLSSLENKLVVLQETLATLPEEISRHLTMTQLNNSSRNPGHTLFS